MLEKANARDNGAYNDQSFMNGKGNVVGFLGEYMVAQAFPKFNHVDTYNHDFECGDITIDVKTKTQNVDFEPKGEYEASVTNESLNHQHPDCYIFCRIYKNKHTNKYEYGWILGAISYDDLMREGRQILKGTDEGNIVFKTNNINIRYDQLTQI